MALLAVADRAPAATLVDVAGLAAAVVGLVSFAALVDFGGLATALAGLAAAVADLARVVGLAATVFVLVFAFGLVLLVGVDRADIVAPFGSMTNDSAKVNER